MAVVRVDFEHTLMRLTDGGHIPSGNRAKIWFFELGDPSRATAETALIEIFKLENARLRANEPSDPNYLAPTSLTSATVLDPPASGPFPWERERFVWERSTCWSRSSVDSVWRPINPGDFTMVYLLRRVQAGELDRETFLRLTTSELFKLPAEEAAKIFSNPEDFLKTRLGL